MERPSALTKNPLQHLFRLHLVFPVLTIIHGPADGEQLPTGMHLLPTWNYRVREFFMTGGSIMQIIILLL
jgi:hypothetical protein